MKYLEEANKILEKLKKQFKKTTAYEELMLSQIETAVKSIKSAEEQMEIDGKTTAGTMKKEEAGYGFIWSRLGDKKMHPGVTIVEKNKTILDKCIASLKPDIEDETKSKLGAMMQATGGKKKKAS